MKAMNWERAFAALARMTTDQLRQKYGEVFGEETNGRNKAWLVKRIAWRLQVQAEGGLSERGRQRAEELADEADLRLNPPPMKPQAENESAVRVLPFAADERLPPPGTVIARKYKGRTLQVKVRADGFEYEGELHASLSAVAKVITGSHCNGFHFFKLTRSHA